jgi:hypothetical protein
VKSSPRRGLESPLGGLVCARLLSGAGTTPLGLTGSLRRLPRMGGITSAQCRPMILRARLPAQSRRTSTRRCVRTPTCGKVRWHADDRGDPARLETHRQTCFGNGLSSKRAGNRRGDTSERTIAAVGYSFDITADARSAAETRPQKTRWIGCDGTRDSRCESKRGTGDLYSLQGEWLRNATHNHVALGMPVSPMFRMPALGDVCAFPRDKHLLIHPMLRPERGRWGNSLDRWTRRSSATATSLGHAVAILRTSRAIAYIESLIAAAKPDFFELDPNPRHEVMYEAITRVIDGAPMPGGHSTGRRQAPLRRGSCSQSAEGIRRVPEARRGVAVNGSSLGRARQRSSEPSCRAAVSDAPE